MIVAARCFFPVTPETTIGAGPGLCGKPATCGPFFCDAHGRVPPVDATVRVYLDEAAARELSYCARHEAKEARTVASQLSGHNATSREDRQTWLSRALAFDRIGDAVEAALRLVRLASEGAKPAPGDGKGGAG